MARLLVVCLLLLTDLITVLATARRPFAGVIHHATESESSELDWHTAAHPPAASDKVRLSVQESPATAGAPRKARHHLKHRSNSKSIIGAEVILGCFATAAAVAILCYIRITRRRSDDEKS